VLKNWLPQFKEAASDVAAANLDEPRPAPPRAGGAEISPVDDLPLIAVPAKGEAKDAFAVILTGDGGWSGLDKEVASALSDRGVGCVGWNSLKYYWTKRTPESASGDLARILRHTLAGLADARVMLVGYSLGADVVSFLAARLPDDLKSRIASVTMIAPSPSVAFEFHLSNWLGGSQPDALPTLPEVEKLAGMKLLCLYGNEEKDSLCNALPAGLAEVDSLPGGHHFAGDYQAVAARILKTAGL
jgi:type IV secretory pathway VirJ component